MKLERLSGIFRVKVDEVFGILKNSLSLKGLSLLNIRTVHSAWNGDARLREYNGIEDLALNFYYPREGDIYSTRDEDLHLIVERDENDVLFSLQDKLESSSNEGTEEDDDDENEESDNDFLMLEKLQPHTELKALHIINYFGVGYPRWIGHHSFHKLNEVELSSCKIGQLPTLGQLPSLKHLHLHSIYRLKIISHEFCQGIKNNRSRDAVAFPSLIKLEFEDMYSWEEWNGVRQGDFPNLQSLSICDCPRLSSLPALRNLSANLDLSLNNCPRINISVEECFPPNVETLECRNFETRIFLSPGAKLPKLESIEGIFRARNNELFEILNNLPVNTFILDITALKNVHTVMETEANLKSQHELGSLTLKWSDPGIDDYYVFDFLLLVVEDNDDDGTNQTENESFFVLEKLQPHVNLRQLFIECYDGVGFPTWVGHPSFLTLKEVTLRSCMIEQLPPLCQLPSLEYLYLHSIYCLNRIGNDFCRDINNNRSYDVVAFPSLINLDFQEMYCWEEWDGVRQGDFPKLRSLSLHDCPKLLSVPVLRNLGTNFDLSIKECPGINISLQESFPPNVKTLRYGENIHLSPEAKLLKVERLIGIFTLRNNELFRILNNLPVNNDYLSIKALRNVRVVVEANANLRCRRQLKSLTLKWSTANDNGCTSLWLVVEDDDDDGTNQVENGSFFVLEKLQPHINLHELNIEGYDAVGYPSWIGHPSFKRLTSIKLCHCITDRLPTLGQLPSLDILILNSISGLKKIGGEFCRNTRRTNDHHNVNVAFPSLTYLIFKQMHDWEEWHGVLDEDFPLLTTLGIEDCPNLRKDMDSFPLWLLNYIDD